MLDDKKKYLILIKGFLILSKHIKDEEITLTIQSYINKVEEINNELNLAKDDGIKQIMDKYEEANNIWLTMYKMVLFSW